MSDRWARLAGEERAALLAFLGGAKDEDWGRPTACAPWTVKEVLAHLVDLDIVAGRVYRGEIAEYAFTDEAEREGVRRWDALPGPAVRAALWQHGRAAQGVAEQLGEAELARPIRVFGATDIRHLLRVHFFEIAVHSHDITAALGARPLWGERARALAEIVLRAVPAALAASDLSPDGSLRVEIAGAGGWTLAGGPQGWMLVDAEDSSARLLTDPETLVLATTGRLAVAEALDRSRVEGDRTFAESVLSAWRIACPVD